MAKNHDLLDHLRPIAARRRVTLAQLVVNWTIHQPGITSVLCGAKRREQVLDNAGGAGWQLDEADTAEIAAALVARGAPISRAAV